MANEILIKNGTALTWKNSGGDYALTFGGLAASGDGQQGVKGDLGGTRAARFICRITVDPNVAPTAGRQVDVFWASSPSATAGTSNPAGTTGTDAAFTDADLLGQLQFVGSLILDNTTNDQTADVGIIVPHYRYGMPVVWNASDQAMNATEGNQSLVITPIVDEVQ